MHRLISLVALFLVVSALPATAGTPLPPAFGGGFVPPNATAAKGADASIESFAQYAGFISKCYRKATRLVFSGQADLLSDCLLAGQVRYEGQAYVREFGKGWLAPCLAGAPTQALLDSVEAFLGTVVPAQIWCDGSTPLPGHFGGGFVASNKNFLDGENVAHAHLTRYWRVAAACYRKGVKRLRNGLPDDTAFCVASARGRLDGKFNGLIQDGKTPACLGMTQQQAYADAWDAFVKGMNPTIFCASPSGAFVDGVAGF